MEMTQEDKRVITKQLLEARYTRSTPTSRSERRKQEPRQRPHSSGSASPSAPWDAVPAKLESEHLARDGEKWAWISSSSSCIGRGAFGEVRLARGAILAPSLQ